ncbi:3-hydroxyacyl-CoA dehydrogenase NAD-binding domain-containing protein [Streptomyces sp. NPDC091217]|uniref:3-hydroxyacyl-CoA dehydrogenase NAD-binding domain-containing protein n=1 Tax=Streptomyces sp. NPDC091217 TaxID=3365975 RepID=UPI00381DB1E9
MTHQFRTVAVIGAGTIGLSWTALFAAHGLTVRVSDPRPDLAEATAGTPDVFGPHLAARGLETDGLTDRVHLAADITGAVRDADVVQENGPERVEFKKELFARLVREAPGHALLLSSSSAIPSSVFTTETEDAGRILIGHPFNPPHLLPLVEVVPGFVGNRLQNALNRQAVHLVQQGVITPEYLDTVVTHSLDLGEPSQDPEDRERVIQEVEKAYAATPYADLAEARDRAQLAVLSALADVRPNQKEN